MSIFVLSVLPVALRVLYFSCFLPHCPPVCMPAAGCQPIRPPGQFLQPLSLLQRHQHRQGSPGGHQLLPLLRDLCPEGGQRPDALPECGHDPGNRAGSGSHIATCWRATAAAAGYHFTYWWVMGSWEGGGGDGKSCSSDKWTDGLMNIMWFICVKVSHSILNKT